MELIAVKEFCRRYSVGRTTFYKLVKDGALTIRKRGTRTLISVSDAEAWATALPKRTCGESPPLSNGGR